MSTRGAENNFSREINPHSPTWIENGQQMPFSATQFQHMEVGNGYVRAQSYYPDGACQSSACLPVVDPVTAAALL